MNAIPVVSHSLLISTVAEQRSVHALSAVEKNPFTVEPKVERNAPSSDGIKAALTERTATVRRRLTPGKISGSWPFFE